MGKRNIPDPGQTKPERTTEKKPYKITFQATNVFILPSKQQSIKNTHIKNALDILKKSLLH